LGELSGKVCNVVRRPPRLVAPLSCYHICSPGACASASPLLSRNIVPCRPRRRTCRTTTLCGAAASDAGVVVNRSSTRQ
jgi:hypothetical protein